MRKFRILALAAVCGCVVGCAGQTFAPDSAPEYIVIRDFSPVYRLGPMQGRGPDATLKAGDRVKVSRREMGYSLVTTEETGQTGYIANEDIAPAPPRPPKPPEQQDSPGNSRSRASSPRYQGEQVNDSPLPESAPLPELDLNVGMEDIVPAESVPSATPSAPPKFRY